MPTFLAHLENCPSDHARKAALQEVEGELKAAGIVATVEGKPVNLDGQLRIDCPEAITLERLQKAIHSKSVFCVESEEQYIADERLEMMGVICDPDEPWENDGALNPNREERRDS